MLVTALCRILREDGLEVAPFKAQNMSNNSYVTLDGGEIGRAQVNQAEAAGVEPETDMNPILLKPESDRRAQIVLDGKPYRTAAAGEYQELEESCGRRLPERSTGWSAIRRGHHRRCGEPCRDQSAADGYRQHARGSVCQRSGDPRRRYRPRGRLRTPGRNVQLIELRDRALVRATVINKFRGDFSLLEPGLKLLKARTGIPVAGVIPYLRNIDIPEEDAVALDSWSGGKPGAIDVGVLRLPHISNFDDLDPLDREPSVSLRYITTTAQFGHPDLIVLPGTKSTIADLAWLRARGLADSVTSAVRNGTALSAFAAATRCSGSKSSTSKASSPASRACAGWAFCRPQPSSNPPRRLSGCRPGYFTTGACSPVRRGTEFADMKFTWAEPTPARAFRSPSRGEPEIRRHRSTARFRPMAG